MKKTLMLLVAAAVSASGSAWAQVGVDEFNKLRERVAELEKANVELVGQLRRVAEGGVKQGELITDLSRRASKTEEGLGTLGKRVSDNEIKLEDLARPDPSNPQRNMVDVLGNMQRSQAFRSDLHMATIGRLIITNETRADQHLYINGTLWRVIQGKSFVTVPRGAVAVQRPGAAQEVVDNWQYDHGRGFVAQYGFTPPPPPTGP